MLRSSMAMQIPCQFLSFTFVDSIVIYLRLCHIILKLEHVEQSMALKYVLLYKGFFAGLKFYELVKTKLFVFNYINFLNCERQLL